MFYFCSAFFLFLALHFTPMRKEGKSCFFCWREERLKPYAVSFVSEKLVEIEGFGQREADRVHRRPPQPAWADENSDSVKTRDWDL